MMQQPGNGAKKTIHNKGILNNDITTIIFELLEKNGIKLIFVKKLNDRDQLSIKNLIYSH